MNSNLSSEEIKRQIDENDEEIERILKVTNFVLNQKVVALIARNDALRSQCHHVYGEDGMCLYCYSLERGTE